MCQNIILLKLLIIILINTEQKIQSNPFLVIVALLFLISNKYSFLPNKLTHDSFDRIFHFLRIFGSYQDSFFFEIMFATIGRKGLKNSPKFETYYLHCR
jgi:hypothetical protein